MRCIFIYVEQFLQKMQQAALLPTAGRPPTRQTCLVKLFTRIENLAAVADHLPDRPAVQKDWGRPPPHNNFLDQQTT